MGDAGNYLFLLFSIVKHKITLSNNHLVFLLDRAEEIARNVGFSRHNKIKQGGKRPYLLPKMIENITIFSLETVELYP